MKVVVLCGGISTERAISIVSGTEVCRALRAKGHDAILMDVFFGNEDATLMDAFPKHYDVDAALEYIKSCEGRLAAAMANPNRSYFGSNVIRICRMADIVFLALHGQDGENGKVQAAFDLQKIPYTGSGYVGSSLSMDKTLTKMVFCDAGIPTPKWFHLRKADYTTILPKAGFTFPVVVKVANGGSSVGVYIAHDPKEYADALREAFALEKHVLVEEYIKGREVSVGVIDGQALPVIEITPKEGFYDYKNKYTAGATIETCPADLSSATTNALRSASVSAFRALRLEGYARFDFMIDADENIYCLEANTLPGMTPTSLIPQEAAAVGMDFGELCERLIEVSYKKYRR